MQAADFLGDEQTVKVLCSGIAQQLLSCGCHQESRSNRDSSTNNKRRRFEFRTLSDDAAIVGEEVMAPGQVRHQTTWHVNCTALGPTQPLQRLNDTYRVQYMIICYRM